MAGSQYAEDRWYFIERIQEWFERKNQFWLLLSILSFGSVLVLQVLLNFATQTNPGARQDSEFLVVPLLSVFIMSTFWRSIIHTFLSFSGSSITYGGMFLFHAKDMASQLASVYTANRLGFGIEHIATASPSMIADRYFVVGMFALAFCLAIAIKPKFFKSKNSEELPYQVWRHSKNFRATQKAGLIGLLPLSSLLTFEEQHIIARYKYVVVAISGTKYLVTPYDWVPSDSIVIRDEESDSVIGIL